MAPFGLIADWRTKNEPGSISVTCIVTHEMGHSESTSLSGPPDSSGKKNSIQEIGSTVSYLERYTLFAITGLAATDQDDDGEGSGPISAKDASEYEKAVEDLQMDKGKFLEYLHAKSFETLTEVQGELARVAIVARRRKRESEMTGGAK